MRVFYRERIVVQYLAPLEMLIFISLASFCAAITHQKFFVYPHTVFWTALFWDGFLALAWAFNQRGIALEGDRLIYRTSLGRGPQSIRLADIVSIKHGMRGWKVTTGTQTVLLADVLENLNDLLRRVSSASNITIERPLVMPADLKYRSSKGFLAIKVYIGLVALTLALTAETLFALDRYALLHQIILGSMLACEITLAILVAMSCYATAILGQHALVVKEGFFNRKKLIFRRDITDVKEISGGWSISTESDSVVLPYDLENIGDLVSKLIPVIEAPPKQTLFTLLNS